MLFNSYEFIFLFLPIMFFGYFYLTSRRLIIGSKVWLVLGSLFFYSYWNVLYLPLILASMLVNYAIGSSMPKFDKARRGKRPTRKQMLIAGILFNIGLLGYFKYTDFFLENFNGLFGASIPLPHIALPLAISFFTFQQIAYLVDSYRNEAKEYDLLNYAVFVTFFPQLIAGPIVHHKEMMPQFSSKWNMVKNYRNIALGLFIFSIGLFKKVVIADTFAQWATQGFDHAPVLNLFEAWATSLSYTFQLYFDFSGYTDMAIGAALLFNIRLPINFNSPYKARSIQDFWRRWHITLSRFLRDYVYVPLGGNRSGRYRTYGNLFATFLIGGLWHGASWMFVIWGALHGVAMIIHRIWQALGFRLWGWLAWLVTFNFINVTWVFFRAESMDDALKVLRGMVGLEGVVFRARHEKYIGFMESYGAEFGDWLANINGNDRTIGFIIAALVVVLVFRSTTFYLKKRTISVPVLVMSCVMLFYALISLNNFSEFLYFNF
jgi:D-alanyl-lipoteichoic acid acyltransferase DltB (MBOAT superfamily)